jgi:hypothetical protein
VEDRCWEVRGGRNDIGEGTCMWSGEWRTSVSESVGGMGRQSGS